MATSIADLFVSVTSDVSGAISGLTDVDQKVNSTSSAMQNATPAALALAGAASTVGAGFLSSVTVAANFEQQINGIKAVMSPTEVNQFGAAIADLALKLGKDTVFTSAQAANAIEDLIKAGVPLPAILDGAARSALDLASATGTDVAVAATLASTAMNTFHLSASELPGVMDAISNVSNATAASVGTLQQGLSDVGSVANQFGLSFRDTALALGVFANNGLSAQTAGTAMKVMLEGLIPSTKAQKTEFAALGLTTADGGNAFFDATGKIKSMSDIAGILQGALAGMSNEQKAATLQILFGTQGMQAAAIVAAQGSAGFDAVSASMDKMGGTAVAAAQRNSGLVGSLNQLQGSFETIQITVGNLLLPYLTQLADSATVLLNRFLSLDPATQNTIIVMVGVAGAVAGLVSAFILLGPALASVGPAFGALAIAAGEVSVPIIALGAAGAALYAAWQTNFGGIRDVTLQVWQAIQPAFANILGFIDSLRNGSAANGLLSAIQPLAAAMEPFVAGALAQLPGLVAAAGDAFNRLGTSIGPIASLFGGVVTAFATGQGSLALVIDAIRVLFGNTVADALTPFLNWFTAAQPELQQFASNVGNLFQAFAAVVSRIFQGDLPGALDIFQTDVVSAGGVLVTQLGQWAQAFIDWITPLIPPLLAELGKLATAVGGWIATTGLPTLLAWASAFLDWVAPLIPPLLTELGKIIVAIAQWVIGELPVLVNILLQLGTAFLSWVLPIIPPLLLQLAQLLATIAGWVIGTALPLLAQQVFAWGGAFINWVGATIPPLLLELAKLLVSIAGWIIGTALPALTQYALQFGSAFLGWVAPLIPPLLLELAQITATIAGWIIGTALPLIASQVFKWGGAFIGWAGATIPPLLLDLAQITAAIATWAIGTALPMLTQYALQFGTTFLSWVLPIIPPLLLQLGDLLAAVAGWVIGTALPLLRDQLFQWGVVFIDWVGGTVPPLLAALGDFLLVMANWIIGVALPEIASLTIQWVGPFLSWITGDVIPQLGPALQNLLAFIGDQLALLPAIIISVLGDPWAPFVNATFAAGARIATAIGDLAGVISQNLGPVLGIVGTVFTTVLNAFLAMPDAVQNVLLAITGLSGAFVLLGGDLSGLLLADVTLSPLILVLGGLAVAAGALYAAWQDDFGGIREVTLQVWDAIQPAFANIVTFIGTINDTLGPMFSGAQGSASPFIEQMSQSLTPILAQLPGLVRQAGDQFNQLGVILGQVADAVRFLVGGDFAAFYRLLADNSVPLGFVQALAQIHSAFDAIGPVVEMVAQAFNFLITGNLDRLVELMQEGLPQPFAAGLQLLHDIIVVQIQVWGDLLGGIRNFIGYLAAGDFQAAFNSLIATFGRLKDDVLPLWNEFLLVVGNLLQGLGPLVAQNVPNMWQALLDEFGRLPGQLQPYWDSFLSWLGSVIVQVPGFIGSQIGNLWGALVQAFGDLVPQVAPAWDNFAGWLGNVLSGIPQFVADGIGDLWGGLRAAFEGLPDMMSPAWDAFAGWFGAVLGGIPQFVGDMAGDVWAALRAAFDGLADQLSPAWDNFAGWFGGVLSGIPQFVGDMAGDVWAALRTAFDGLVDQLAPSWDVFAGWFGAILGGIPQFVGDNMGDVWAGLSTTFGGLVDTLAPSWDVFAGWFGAVLQGLPQFVLDNIGDVFGGIVDQAVALVSRIGSAIDPVRQLIADTFGNVMNWVASGGTPTPGTTGDGTGATGGTGGTGGGTISGPLVTVGTLIISNQAEADAFLQQMADAILASARRVTPPNPFAAPAGV